jgi:hypothetical protein
LFLRRWRINCEENQITAEFKGNTGGMLYSVTTLFPTSRKIQMNDKICDLYCHLTQMPRHYFDIGPVHFLVQNLHFYDYNPKITSLFKSMLLLLFAVKTTHLIGNT